ncbi:MAG: hypothetical protein HQK53_14140 [Oligoflexia bacterium]|nr:hypothetical protein [Oligoflexia bacterium]
MKVSIFSKNLFLNKEINNYICDLIREDFHTLEEKINTVKITIEDINGPTKGGVDKKCRIELKLLSKGPQRVL